MTMWRFLKKQKSILISALVMAGLAGGVFFAYEKFTGQSFLSPSAELVLKGFNPGTKLSYNLFETGADADPVKGEDIAGADGILKIPALPADKYNALARIYDLKLQEAGQKDTLNLTLTLDARANRVAVLGEGLEEFAPVRIEVAGQIYQTQADWAGLLNAPEEMPLFNEQSGQSDGLKIALLGNGLPDEVRQQNPRIIQIFQAPGGGGPTGQGVNSYSATHCGGLVRYSWCNGAWMQGHITKLRVHYVEALQMMSTEFSAIMMQQAQIFGSFLDAKQQLEMQRDFQVLTAEAHKDYHPSDQMCRFGTFVRSVAETEAKSGHDKRALNSILMAAYTGQKNASTAEGYATDIQSRITQFRSSFCGVGDNNDQLSTLCDHDQNLSDNSDKGATDKNRINKDIDFARTLWGPLTVNVNFKDAPNPESDEADILALARNLYWPQAIEPGLAKDLPGQALSFTDARRLFAVQNVAHNSFANIVALKAQSAPGLGAQSGWNYMKSLLRDFGLPDADIHALMGAYPSYYAQMEVLTKKIYQSPDFYTNLYDKPANVKRIGASMDAIKIMQGRDMLDAALRREMLTSMLVEDALKAQVDNLNGRIAAEITNTR
jgi:hypothetical protein